MSRATGTNLFLDSTLFDERFKQFQQAVQSRSGVSFVSFNEGGPLDMEGYKEDVRREALHILNCPKWTQRQVGRGEILEQVIAAIEINVSKRVCNNTVRWENRWGHKSRSHRALLDARSDESKRREFEQWFLDFFQGRLDKAEAFEIFLRLAGERYDLVAYLFFLNDWTRFMPIATTTFDKAFQLLNLDVVTARNCSWENYSQYNKALAAVHSALCDVAEVAGARLIDAHSFCWMLVRLELPATSPAIRIPLPETLTNLQAAVSRSEVSAVEARTGVVGEDQFIQRDAERRRIGKLAQDIALKSECRRLREAGHPNPEEAVTPVWDQPARGYDILSCELDGSPRHIEVKAARESGQRLSFFLTQNEWEQSRSLANYYFYLVINAQSQEPHILVVDRGEVSSDCLAPVNYLASLLRTATI